MKNANLTKLLALSLLALTSANVYADAASSAKYKMVVIENTPGVDALQSGDVSKGMALTRAASKYELDTYTRSLNLCVGYTRLSELEKVKKACTDAVNAARYTNAPTEVDLKAYAYNNRAIAKLMANDKIGALEDFKKAAAAGKHEIYIDNLNRLELTLNESNTGV